MKACNNSGVWNEAGASFDFSIDPAYYQTAWFKAACGTAFLALLWLLYWLRLHQIAQEFNARLEERVNLTFPEGSVETCRTRSWSWCWPGWQWTRAGRDAAWADSIGIRGIEEGTPFDVTQGFDPCPRQAMTLVVTLSEVRAALGV